MAIRAVVFDIGGVLEFVGPTGWVERWEAELGFEPGDFAVRTEQLWAAARVGDVSLSQLHRELQATLGLEPARVDALMEDVWIEYLGQPNTELIDYASSLRPRYRTAILSNSLVGARERESERYAFERIVDLIVYSHEEGLAKPDPRSYLLTCARLDVRPHEAVFVDDMAERVKGASDVGMRGVLFRDNAQTIAAIDAYLRAVAG